MCVSVYVCVSVCVGGCTMGLRGSDVFPMLHTTYGSLLLSLRGVRGVGNWGFLNPHFEQGSLSFRDEMFTCTVKAGG